MIGWIRRGALIALLAGASPLASALPSTASGPCGLSVEDRQWLDGAMTAWAYSRKHLTTDNIRAPVRVLIFDAQCLLSGTTSPDGTVPGWSGSPHGEMVQIPTGESVPAQVVSFAAPSRQGNFLLMSTPSVWRAGGVDGGPLGLKRLMTAVMLHEGSHVSQFGTYGARMTALTREWHLPDSFNDDAIQERFGSNPEFSASIARETDLFLQAADAPDHAEARRLAREARDMMTARQARWYPDKDGYLREAEDIWLTMEGSGQWAGYEWLIARQGAALSPAEASASFGKRGGAWSQLQGFAMFKALTRLTGDRWKQHVYGDGRRSLFALMDEAVGERR